MVRRILGLLAGLVTAVVVIWVVEYLGHQLFPPSTVMDPDDPASIAAHMDSLPLGALLAVPVAWCLGTFAGVLVAIRLLGGQRLLSAVVVGTVMAVAGAMMLLQISSPSWFVALGIASFPTGALGAVLLAATGDRDVETEPTG